jgi:multiple sugar transport system permease protein
VATSARAFPRPFVRSRARAAAPRRTHHRAFTIGAYLVLAFGVLWTVIPFYWMALTSFKTNKQIYEQAIFFPTSLYLGHYADLFKGPFPIWVRNSAIVAGFTTALSIVVGALAAYSIARLRFGGRTVVARGLIFTYLIPSSLLFIPLFQVVASLGLVNNLGSLMLVYLTFTVPFCTWLMIGYFRTIPQELEEAALIDGCGRLGALVRVTLPLSAPAISVVALFSFTLSWNEFLYALVFINSIQARTAPVGLSSLVAQDVFFWGAMMGGAVLTSIPPVIVYVLAQRLVVKGLAVGGVKG